MISTKGALLLHRHPLQFFAAPYYALKPSLFALRFVERLAGKWGTLTIVARKPEAR